MEFYIWLTTGVGLFIRFRLFQSHGILSRQPAPVYGFVSTSGLCCTIMGAFLALGVLHMPLQVASPGAKTP